MDLRAVIFMPAFAGAVIFGFVFVLFVSHYYLTVLEGTATGAKEVTWQAEPILDNFWKFWYMLWLFGLWFGPGYLIAKAVGERNRFGLAQALAANCDRVAPLSGQSTVVALGQHDLAAARAGRLRAAGPEARRHARVLPALHSGARPVCDRVQVGLPDAG